MPERSGYDSPAAVEAAFYDALSRADLAQMEALWADSEAALCVHPGGPPLRGFAAVRESWRSIFARGPALEVELGPAEEQRSGDLAVRSLIEHLRPLQGDARVRVLATNVYRREAGGWLMLMHHASPLPSRKGAEGSGAQPEGRLH